MITRRMLLAATGGLVGMSAAQTVAAQQSTIKALGRNETMQITRAGSQPSVKGPSEYFTGTVRIDPLFPVRDPSPCLGRRRDIRTRCSHRLAHASAGPD